MEAPKKKRLALVLSIAMVFVMLMGPGPGLRLVNPDIENTSASFTVAGIPVIYVWGLFWFVIQVTIILTAYYTVWNEEEQAVE